MYGLAYNFMQSSTPPWLKIVQMVPNRAKHHIYYINRKLINIIETELGKNCQILV